MCVCMYLGLGVGAHKLEAELGLGLGLGLGLARTSSRRSRCESIRAFSIADAWWDMARLACRSASRSSIRRHCALPTATEPATAM